MIKITSIHVRDFGRHREVKSQLKGHVVGLSGPNGLGKSTILQALQFGLTGTIDHKDPLPAFIRRSSESEPPSAAEVTVEFEADGKHGRIQRRITRTGATRKLWWDGAEKPMTSDAQVSATLFDILGVDKTAINSTVFIRQGEMSRMFGGDVERRDFYSKLLMLGHLAKIAGVVQTFREQVASTVQDLGAVKDSAEEVYESARVYFEDCEADCERKPSMAEAITYVRQVSRAYDQLSECQEAASAAEISMRRYDTGGADVAEWAVSEQRKLDALKDREIALQKGRVDNLTLTNDLTRAEGRLNDELALRTLVADIDRTEQELRDSEDPGEDPAEMIEKCGHIIAHFATFDAAVADLPGLQQQTEAAETELESVKLTVFQHQAEYQAARDTYATTSNMLKLSRGLADSIKGVDCAGHCPVCGSNKTDSEFLAGQIKSLESQLHGAQLSGENARKNLETSNDKRRALDQAYSSLKTKCDETSATVTRLKVRLSLSSKERVEAQLADAKSRLNVYHSRLQRRRQLEEQVTKLNGARRNRPLMKDVSLEALQAEIEELRASVVKSAWTPVEAQELSEVTSQISSLDALLRDVSTKLAARELADRKAVAASEALSSLVHSQPAGFDWQADGILTHGIVSSKLESLERMQQASDEAKGKRIAANSALRDASARIDELSMRSAEQASRIKLVEKLERLRDTFKPDGASLEFLNHKFGRIARLAADYLAESGADFMVAASDDIPLSFNFLRTDRVGEVWMAQNRLSGGQKVRLAVATLRAIHALIMPNVGLLVLDEPTTHLDDEVKVSMAEMLHRIGDEGTLQLIVCDHSPALIEAFSDRIEIGED